LATPSTVSIQVVGLEGRERLNRCDKLISVFIRKAFLAPFIYDGLPDAHAALNHSIAYQAGPVVKIWIKNGILKISMKISRAYPEPLVKLRPCFRFEFEEDHALRCVFTRQNNTTGCYRLVTVEDAETWMRKLSACG
jgi:hypothetical protein